MGGRAVAEGAGRSRPVGRGWRRMAGSGIAAVSGRWPADHSAPAPHPAPAAPYSGAPRRGRNRAVRQSYLCLSVIRGARAVIVRRLRWLCPYTAAGWGRRRRGRRRGCRGCCSGGGRGGRRWTRKRRDGLRVGGSGMRDEEEVDGIGLREVENDIELHTAWPST